MLTESRVAGPPVSLSLPEGEFAIRVARTRERMREAGLDALFVYSDEYRPGAAFYYTNHRTIDCIEESHYAVFLPLEGELVGFTGPLNTFAAKCYAWIKGTQSIFGLDRWLLEMQERRAMPLRRVGLIGQAILPLEIYRLLQRGLAEVELVSADKLLTGLRQIKSAAELVLLEQAAQLADASLKTAAEAIEVGKTEVEISAVGEYVTRAAGGEIGSAYLVISGPNTNLPTWRPTERTLQRGEYVILDFNPSYKGYCCDSGITLLTPAASEEQRRVLQFAWDTNERMVDYVRPGMLASDLFRKTARLVEDTGYSEYFLPYTKGMRAIGHGVGLEVVEPPDLGPNSSFVFEPGMVFGFKFDLHGFPFGGVRIERTVAITESGARLLNNYDAWR